MTAQAPASYATRRYNPITGCEKGLPCWPRCWARSFATRHRGRFGYPRSDPFRPTFHPDRIDEPLRWRGPQTVAVAFMGDIGSPGVRDSWLCALWAVMALTPQHTYLLLSKRPDRIASWLRNGRTYDGVLARANILRDAYRRRNLFSIGISNPATAPLRNVWIGTSFGNQPEADDRVSRVLAVPAANRWASYEPATGPADLTRIRLPPELSSRPGDHWTINALTDQDDENFHNDHAKIDLVVVGAESGPKRRPFDQAWARAMRDRCAEHGTPYYLKQIQRCRMADGCKVRREGCDADGQCDGKPSLVVKHPFLDGRQHLDVPWATKEASR